MKESVCDENNYGGSLDQSTSSQNTDGFRENSMLSNTLTSSEEASNHSRCSSQTNINNDESGDDDDCEEEFENVKQEKFDDHNGISSGKRNTATPPAIQVKGKLNANGFNHSTPVLRDLKNEADDDDSSPLPSASSMLLFNTAPNGHLSKYSMFPNAASLALGMEQRCYSSLDKMSVYAKEGKKMTQNNMHHLHNHHHAPQQQSQYKPITVCSVCGDRASGKHYGVLSCDGCRGFFKRSIRGNMEYVCKENNKCIIDVSRRNQCQSCRLKRCLEVKMNKDAVQHQRPPRSQQIKREFSSTVSSSTLSSEFHTTISGNPNATQHHLDDNDSLVKNNSGAENSSSFYKSRFSPYPNYQSVRGGFRQNNNPNEHLPPLRNTKLIETSPIYDAQNASFFNVSSSSIQAANEAAIAALFPASSMLYHKNPVFNPFKNISLNLSENSASPSFSYDPCASRNVSSLSSGYCSLDENNSKTAFNTSQMNALYENMHNKLQQNAITPPPSNSNKQSHLNSSASMAHIMNWIKNEPASVEQLVDLTSRILLSAIKWTKTQRNFLNLPFNDQVLLLNENISELFILQMAENKSAFNEIKNLAHKESDVEKKGLYESLEQILYKFQLDKVDPMEFYLLKSISLFKSNLRDIEVRSNIEKIQEECFISLFSYTKLNYPACPRFGRLLILYTDLRKYTSKIVEEWLIQNVLGKKNLPNFLEELIKVA